MRISHGCGWVGLGLVFLSACTHAPVTDREPAGGGAIPKEGRPLYPMMGLDVVVKPGDVDRAPLGKHWAPHELATERSQPVGDPSLVLGYHLELAELRKQEGVAKDQAWQSLTTMPPFFSRDSDRTLNFEKAIAADPSLLRLYELHRDRYAPGRMRTEDGPAIVNSDYEYRNISDREFGYCWGFATFNRFFAQLAFFDDRVVPHGLPAYVWGGFEKNEVWFRYYEKKIDQILDGKAALIPGFKDFRSFTLIPEIEFYIKLKAMKLWSARAISLSMLKTFFTSTKPLKDAEIGALLRELKMRTDRGELPKIMFTAKNSHKVFGGTADVHVVLANGVELNPDGSGKILLWDINFYAEDYLKSPKYIEVRRVPGKGRELHYGPWFENKETPKLTAESTMLGQVRITPENGRENDEMITSLKRFCAAASTAKYCL